MNDKPIIRCAIYTRKSTEEGLEQDFNSLDAQHEACESYIASQKAEGWTALSIRYDDGGYSGGTLQRPALQRLLKDIEEHTVDVVVVYKIDRLSRSLMDFAKLVEVFDRKSVTFVSVTQSFNTTTSMGRLTLNVLLSFAQFEREVTGERIRDKFAASKKKGIWMGGNPPLGYDVSNRKLVVNISEAETIRFIFQRYLDLGCARLLRDELIARQVVSKRRVSKNENQRGGKPMGRSALYCILNNRAYIGETVHKGKAYRGEHEAIVPAALFNAVQQRLADLRPVRSGLARSPEDAPFAGILFDETGAAMQPTYTVKKGGLRYRYYASKPALKGENSQTVIHRIPAPPFEAFVSGVMTGLGVPGHRDSRHSVPSALRRIDIKANGIAIRFDRVTALSCWREAASEFADQTDLDLINYYRKLLTAGGELADSNQSLVVTIPVRARFRGGRATRLNPPGCSQDGPQPDLGLIKALARAHRWKQMLEDGEVPSIEALARRLKLDRGHVGLTLNLAFLSPELARAIVRGDQPAGLRLTHLLDAEIPLSWADQGAAIAATSGAAAPIPSTAAA